jgi:hypothetical protein
MQSGRGVLKVGDVCLTPFEPRGLVRVTEVPGTSCWAVVQVVFVGNHPHGYKDGETGAYFYGELEIARGIKRTGTD